MSAAEIIAGALNTEIVGHTGDANGGRITWQSAQEFGRMSIATLEEAGYAVVKLPEERTNGYYGGVSVQGDEILICNMWTDTTRAREVAAQILRDADQLEALQEAEAHA